MRWLLGSAVSLACFALVAAGTFLPLRDTSGVQYLFVWPGAATMAVWTMGVSAGLAALYALVVVLARTRRDGDVVAARSGRWLSPIAATGLAVLGLLPAIPGIGEHAAPAAYLFYDLRWWWLITLGALTAWRADRALGQPLWCWASRVARWSSTARLLLADATLFGLVVAWAIVSQPHVRFSGETYGDEPRYLRYCETWYQGHGCDVGRNTLMADAPLDAPSHVWRNAALLPGVLRDEAAAFAADIIGFVRHPVGFQWNRAGESRFGFVTGKTGTGQYELHQPGLSAFLFPGYFIDRHFLGLAPGYQGEFPADLPMTSSMVLLTLGLAAVTLFRLLRHALGGVGPAWMAAAMAMLSFPTSAFAFQFYPESASMLLILAGALYLVRASAGDTGRGVATLAGLAAGGLVWLHPRFVLVSVVLGVAGLVHSTRASRRPFAFAYAFAVLTLGFYDYHITGSWMPNALYSADTEMRQLIWANVPDNLLAYAFHDTWGLLAHAPWLWGVPAGLAVMVRRQPRAAFGLICLTFALAVPAAGHALNPAGGTPGRFVAAILPPLIWPVAVLVRHAWRSPTIRVATVVTSILSLDASWTYNWIHEKSVGPMMDASISGWKPNLAYPSIRNYFERPWPHGYGVFLAMTLVVILSVELARRSTRPLGGRSASPASYVRATIVVLLVILGAATGASAALHQWTREDYQLPDNVARPQAAAALIAREPCTLCFSSIRGRVTWRGLRPNPVGEPRVAVATDGQAIRVNVQLGSENGIDGFCTLQVEFGDGIASAVTPVLGRAAIEHAVATPGTYHVVVQLQLPRSLRIVQSDVVVGPHK